LNITGTYSQISIIGWSYGSINGSTKGYSQSFQNHGESVAIRVQHKGITYVTVTTRCLL